MWLCVCIAGSTCSNALASALNYSCFLSPFPSTLVLNFAQSCFSWAPPSAICLLYWPTCCLCTQFSRSFRRKWSVAKRGSVYSWMGCLAEKCFTTAAGLASFKCVYLKVFYFVFCGFAFKIFKNMFTNIQMYNYGWYEVRDVRMNIAIWRRTAKLSSRRL